jgi:hypothetical protein
MTDLLKRLGTTAEEQLATSVRPPILGSFLRRRRRTPTTSCSDRTRYTPVLRRCGPVNGGSVKSSTGCRTKADSESPNPGTVPLLDALVFRVRGEYGEMPGSQLTVLQACRLWQVEMSTCDRVLEQLVCEGFLYKTDNGAYIAVATSRG